MPERSSTGTGRPVGEPPSPGNPNNLDELAERLRQLWQWSALRQRDIAEAVRQLRIQRGARPDEARLKPAQSSVSALFTTGRKRWDQDLFTDVVRVLLDPADPSVRWREAQVTRWLEAYRAVQDQPMSRIGVRHFRLGPLRTPCQIIEGTGEEAIAEDRVRVLVTPQPVELPAEVAAWRTEIEQEQVRRYQAGRPHQWLGQRYAVEDLVISRVPPLESPAVTLRLRHSDYYTFLAAQQLDRMFRDGSTLRGRYLDGRDPLNVPDFLRSSFGLNAAVVTADDWLVVARRSDRTGVGHGQWNSSANEGLDRRLDGKDGAPPNLFLAMARGLREELRLDQEQHETRLLAFAVVTTLSQWCALFLTRLTLDRATFEENVGHGVPDAWENSHFDYVRFEPEQVLPYLVHPDRRDAWAPAAPSTFYLALVNAYGRARVDLAEQALFG
jgi:hypothetical protein